MELREVPDLTAGRDRRAVPSTDRSRLGRGRSGGYGDTSTRMSADHWTVAKASDVQSGDRVRVDSGTEMTVTVIETRFLGQSHLVCLVEDTDVRWLAMAMTADAEVVVSSNRSLDAFP